MSVSKNEILARYEEIVIELDKMKELKQKLPELVETYNGLLTDFNELKDKYAELHKERDKLAATATSYAERNEALKGEVKSLEKELAFCKSNHASDFEVPSDQDVAIGEVLVAGSTVHNETEKENLKDGEAID